MTRTIRAPLTDWNEFVAKTLSKRPSFFQNRIRDVPFTIDSLFEQVVDHCEEARRTKQRSHVSFSAGLFDASPEASLLFLPRQADRNFEEYGKRLEDQHNLKSFALCLQETHSWIPKLWDWYLGYFHAFLKAAKFPQYVARTDFFLGNYKFTPRGVHFDNVHNFAIGFHGTKILRLWNPKVWDQIDDPEKGIDYTKYLSFGEAYVLNPGDVLYFPPGYYHVAENTEEGREVTASMSFDCATPANHITEFLRGVLNAEVKRQLGKSLDTFDHTNVKKQAKNLPPRIQRILKILKTSLSSKAFLDDVAIQWLARASQYHCTSRLPTTTDGESIRESDLVYTPQYHSILTKVTGDSVVCMSRGHSLEVNYHPAILRLINVINDGHVRPVGAILDRFSKELAGRHKELLEPARLQLMGLLKLFVEIDALCISPVTLPSSKN